MKQTIPDTDLPFMSHQRRELYFRVINNVQNYAPITHRLHYLDNYFPPNKLDRALTWLVQNNIVGVSFCTWFVEECRASDLQMHERLLRIVDNAPVGSIIAGKNFKV